MRTAPVFTFVALFFSHAPAGEFGVSKLGVMTLPMPEIVGRTVNIPFPAPRPGMYETRVKIGTIYAGNAPQPVSFAIDGRTAASSPLRATGGGYFAIGRGYIAREGATTLTLSGPAANDVTSIQLTPAPEGQPVVQQGAGPITLLAQDATVWGTLLRFEPEPHKRCLGYWTQTDDWASWDFTVQTPGTYTATIYQGCGKGAGGSQVTVSSGGTTLAHTVEETGGFQNFIPKELGEFTLAQRGIHTVEVRALTKAGVAVMDVQKVVLEPVGED